MIPKFKQQANKSFIYMAVCLIVGFILTGIACAVNAPIILGVTMAVITVLAFVFAIIFYFRGCNYWAEAKGYTSVVFLAAFFALIGVAILLALLPDQSNPARLAEEENYPGPRCVACDSRIQPGTRYCPKCGWTQPAQDMVDHVVA